MITSLLKILNFDIDPFKKDYTDTSIMFDYEFQKSVSSENSEHSSRSKCDPQKYNMNQDLQTSNPSIISLNNLSFLIMALFVTPSNHPLTKQISASFPHFD